MRQFLAATLALLAAPAMAADRQVECTGAFGIDSSEARLIEIYGADNVETGIVPGPEGMDMLATTVFPGDPRREIQFTWWDEDNLSDPGSIELPSKLIAPGGVHAGQTLEELRTLNGGPFELMGFWWDYGGGASMSDGKLADLPGGCSINIRLAPGDFDESLDVSAVSGDVFITSEEPVLAQMDIRVQRVTLGYPHPDYREDEESE